MTHVMFSHMRVAPLGGQGGSSAIVTAWCWSDLWKDCDEDSSAVVKRVDFGVLCEAWGPHRPLN